MCFSSLLYFQTTFFSLNFLAHRFVFTFLFVCIWLWNNKSVSEGKYLTMTSYSLLRKLQMFTCFHSTHSVIPFLLDIIYLFFRFTTYKMSMGKKMLGDRSFRQPLPTLTIMNLWLPHLHNHFLNFEPWNSVDCVYFGCIGRLME